MAHGKKSYKHWVKHYSTRHTRRVINQKNFFPFTKGTKYRKIFDLQWELY